MTLQCPRCKSRDVALTGSNDADYPETRVEFYDCRSCQRNFRQILHA
jgi:DNA-directed RNA polymerase subunit M/transcription elongation factor TFIIS